MNRWSRGGFTLLEIVVSLIILAIGLSAVFMGTIQAQRTTRAASQLGEATTLAVGILAEVRSASSPLVEKSGSDRALWWNLSIKAGPQAGMQHVAVSVSESTSGIPEILTIIFIKANYAIPQ